MKNFDELLAGASEDDRTFEMRGQKFTFASRVSATRLASFEDVRFGTDSSSLDVLAAADDLICSCLNGQDKEWRKLRESAEPPISWQDVIDVVNHILEVTSARPTERSDDSGPTPSRPSTTSKAGSS